MEKATKITTLASRRQKWHYRTAQQTPRILHLPRLKSTPTKPNRKVKLETLFDQEREFSKGNLPVVMVSDRGEEKRRERVEERESGAVEEEQWRFQAEMLRAECNLLRMEREIAVKKMERRRVQVERALKSAVQTLLSGRKRLCGGKNESIVFEEEIIELIDQLEKLQRIRSKHKDLEVLNCSNFDKQASLLQSRLEKFAGKSNEIYVKEIQEMAEASLSITATTSNISENLLERMKVKDGSTRQLPRFAFGKNKFEDRKCCGCCKAIVRRVVEQIRAETEQWSQMQEVLGQVRDEMEELQASRAFWEDKAISSNHEVQSLNRVAKEWRQKALAFEAKAVKLQAEVSVLEAENEKLRNKRDKKTKNLGHTSYESTNEMEKRVLVCRLTENRREDGRKTTYIASSSRGYSGSKRTPFREIGNSSPLLRQNNNYNSRAVFP